ncbi:MAG TPA: PIG-L deacetylase family protein [Verrucomicrobiales bacterium]|jgi:LmbE family N-acetylglucosaminyl deacetylase|nr:PIG-L deacetylase family protein [Verrucomicrobiales bacterium]
MNRTALAIAAHPDDIEFSMAGTLLQLRDRGWKIHCMNLSTGSQGSAVMSAARTRTVRRAEAKEAARLMGAVWHPPVADDIEILYSLPLLRKVAAVMRKVNPSVVLTHPPVDYMEDHTETCRLAVTAAFCKNFPNYQSTPATKPGSGDVTVYHSMPHMLCNPLGERVHPEAYVDVTDVLDRKTAALAAHASQKQWLDDTQGMDSYLITMQGFSATLGSESGKFRHAEGWRRHLHAGFCAAGADPLAEALGNKYRPRRKKA